MKFSIKRFFKNLFHRGKFIMLDDGPLSSKIAIVGRTAGNPSFGVLQIRRYKDRGRHEYGAEIREEDVGDMIVTIAFGKREGVKRMADSLQKLYESMEDAE